jgi:large subunit ribosomal protein L46
MLRRSTALRFFSQQTIPVVPQGVLPNAGSSEGKKAAAAQCLVGYLLTRQPAVQHSLHPLEQELGFVLDREHQRYCRHQQGQAPTDAESANAFFSSRGIALDSWNRHDKTQIQRDFFNLDAQREATKITLDRYEPARRITKADFVDPFDAALKTGPPPRHSIQRRLDETLLLIVRDGATGKWTVPAREAASSSGFSLRTQVEDAILADHNGALDAYMFGNAPQGVLQWSSEAAEAAAEGKCLPRGAPASEATRQMFIYVASYLTGRPNFAPVERRLPANAADHAWVTRRELADYEYVHDDMYALLSDIVMDTNLLP